MSLVEQAIKRHQGIVDGSKIDWKRWMVPEEISRIIPAEALAEKGKARMLLGAEAEPGLTLPWEKTRGRVLIRDGKLVIWSGWSRHGKTNALKTLMLHAIANGYRPLIVSLEEEIVEIWTDLAWRACGEEQPSPREIDRFVEFVRGRLWLYDQQGRINPQRMYAICRYAATELKVTQIMIDSLMFLTVSRDDYEAQANLCAELKVIAKDTGVTVHLVAHARKRDGKTGEESVPGLHDIAGGHEIGSITDYAFIVWRDIKNAAAQTIVKVDKQRGRISWLGTVGLYFHERSRQLIEDVSPMRFWDEQGEDF